MGRDRSSRKDSRGGEEELLFSQGSSWSAGNGERIMSQRKT